MNDIEDDNGCPGGRECDCHPTDSAVALRSAEPYIGMGVHYVDIGIEMIDLDLAIVPSRNVCRAAFVTLIRPEGLLLAVLTPGGVHFDGDVDYSRYRLAGTWHHIHEES